MSHGTTASKSGAPEQELGSDPGLDLDREHEQTCFVVIGFGMKTDYATGRTLDLDLTYRKLIKPAFDHVGIRCFRAIDVNVTGSIDKLMYHWIYHADFVVADLSTMNANVFYELGVRHAQRPNTTLLMAENGLFSRLPFDLSHTIIYSYEHLGEDIAAQESERFVDLLSGQLEKLLSDPVTEDSPVYTYMPGMQAPVWSDPAGAIRELQVRLEEQHQLTEAALAGDTATIDPEVLARQSLALIVSSAEAAKNRKDFATAIPLFRAATDNDDKDTFLWQRLALVTYKEREDDVDDAAAISSLERAEAILADHCDLALSTDPETLGLAGAINKRLYDRTGEVEYFERSVHHYERGFYIKQDYYNGINVAFMYTLRAAEHASRGEIYDAIVNYGHANLLRKKVAEICEELAAGEGFGSRGDREWVLQTLAQAYLGMEQDDRAEALMPHIQALSRGDFDMSTFREQNRRLLDAMAEFRERVPTAPGPGDLHSSIPAASAEPAPAAGSEVRNDVIAPGAESIGSRSGDPISIDLGSHRDRPIRTVEVTCKVVFEE